MTKKKFEEISEKIIISPIFISFAAFIVATFIVVKLTLTKIPSGYDYELIRDVLVEAHGMLFDILIIGTFIFALHSIAEKRREIKRYQEEIDDLRWWETEEATFKIVGNIIRLNRNGVTNIDLAACYLKKASLKYVELKSAFLHQANLQEADLEGANLQKTDLGMANMQNANLMIANLEGANLNDANIEGADFDHANLHNVKNLTIEQLSKVKTLHEAKLDSGIMEQIKRDYPNLLEWSILE